MKEGKLEEVFYSLCKTERAKELFHEVRRRWPNVLTLDSEGNPSVNWHAYVEALRQDHSEYVGEGTDKIFRLLQEINIILCRPKEQKTYFEVSDGKISLNPFLLGQPYGFVREEDAVAYGQAMFQNARFPVYIRQINEIRRLE